MDFDSFSSTKDVAITPIRFAITPSSSKSLEFLLYSVMYQKLGEQHLGAVDVYKF